MTTITRTNERIKCDGHADNKICCAMLSALTDLLVGNITNRLGITLNCRLEPGIFEIDFSNLTDEAMVLVDSYWFSLNTLSESYPENFVIL